jgi:hypothetical protein
MNNIRLVTCYNGKNNELIIPFLNRLIEYTTKNNYQFSFNVEDFENSQYKIKFINDCLIKYPDLYIVWVDIDIYIHNIEFKIESLLDEKDLIISKDVNGICSGFMIIKNNEWNKKLFSCLNFLQDVNEKLDLIKHDGFGGFLHQNGNHFDQNSMKVLFNYFKQFKSKISFIDESIIQNPETTYSSNSFAYHCWGMWNLSLDDIYKKIHRYN